MSQSDSQVPQNSSPGSLPPSAAPHPGEDRYLSFGIPSLDQLIGYSPPKLDVSEIPGPEDVYYGFALKNCEEPAEAAKLSSESATICIIGPDGTGKSLFALHMASDYARRTQYSKRPPKIIYASTDLSYERAKAVWEAFWLDRPRSRRARLPFQHDEILADVPLAPWEANSQHQFKLNRFHAAETSQTTLENDLSTYLVSESSLNGIAFLDLEESTSGDDWQFLHKSLAVLARSEATTDPRHLLIIDAVEGLETLVGERDSFGQIQSRRARIAQIVRAASNKCHIVFVVEEPKDGTRLDEVFVADLVLRLRSEQDRDFSRRTLELEKVRAQRHARGQQDFGIRQSCSKTGEEPNPDDPSVGEPQQSMAYMQVFPSLHFLTRERSVKVKGPQNVATVTGVSTPFDWRYASFGIYQLDSILWKASDPAYRSENFDVNSLPNDSKLEITSEQKSKLLLEQLDALLRNNKLTLTASENQQLIHLVATLFEYAMRVLRKTENVTDQLYERLATLTGSERFKDSFATLVEYAWAFLRPLDSNDSRHNSLLKSLLTFLCASSPRLSTDDLGILFSVIPERVVESMRDIDFATLPARRAGFDQMGLPAGTITTLIGDDSTYKSQLARSFLSQCFRNRDEFFTRDYLTSAVVLANSSDPLRGQGVAALLTTHDIDNIELRKKLKAHLIADTQPHKNPSQLQGMEKRLLVRKLEPHHLTSSLLIHVIDRLVKEAQRRLFIGLEINASSITPAVRRGFHARIRLVIDDWSTILAMYPEVQRDPLVLPFLVNYLRSQGVTTLVLATRSGNPQERGRGTGELDQDIRELRVMADHHLYTWHVSFFDERRIAITTQPNPIPTSGLMVRELRPGRFLELPGNRLASLRRVDDSADRAKSEFDEQFDTEALVVDPHFELYAGLQDGKPTPVPLQIRLYSEIQELPAFQAYLDDMQYLFGHLFGQNVNRVTIQAETGASYERLRALSYLQSETQLDHTLVLQVDEFWADTRSELLPQDRYLKARTVDRDGRPLKVEDPFGLFQLTDESKQRLKAPVRRVEFLSTVGYDCEEASKRYMLEKVPYSWDFGFLICNPIVWKRAWSENDHRTMRIRRNLIGGDYDVVEQSVWNIWYRLWKIATYDDIPELQSLPEFRRRSQDQAPFAHCGLRVEEKGGDGITVTSTAYKGKAYTDSKGPDPVTWREFFGACKTIARVTQYEYLPFDIDSSSGENLSCLVFEVFFSEVFQAWKNTRFGDFKEKLEASKWWPRTRREHPYSVSLSEMVATTGMERTDEEKRMSLGLVFRRALYRAVLLIDEVLGKDQLKEKGLILESRQGSSKAAACRHWYSTASIAMKGGADSRNQLLVGLPGHYAARGDWYIAVSKGSRSPRLGERAMDILGSRRANITRLQNGLGLPVRDLFTTSEKPPASQARLEYWTCLPYIADDLVPYRIAYRDLRQLGAYDKGDGFGRDDDFFWIWRSSISRYDVHSRIFQRWLVDLFKKWRVWETPIATDWPRDPCPPKVIVPAVQLDRPYWDAFWEYDHYLRCEFSGAPPCYVDDSEESNGRWAAFNASCDGLIETLKRASLQSVSADGIR